ncbi:odorant receptor 33b-like [Diachasma alloeum]|uniref:Odorant receptor n=1 Tax=Diachasma alloeum TaxID=454923 RepID=A0A4E0S3X1_9HYME|nr:odorant receptor 33b-like [Diachasma alloeum]THK33245.1 odorant receptor 25 [Diachasma alloeum]
MILIIAAIFLVDEDHLRSGFDYACGWNRFNFDLLGIWPRKNATGIAKYRSLINASVIFLILVIPRSIALYLFWGQIDAMIQCFSTHMPLIIGMVKLIILYFQQQVLGEFLEEMEVDWKVVKPTLHHDTMMKMANISRGISIVSSSMAYAANSFGVVKFYNLESFHLKDPDPRLTMNLFWVVCLPFDTSTSINFWVALLLQFYASFSGSLSYFAFDSLVAMMIFHLCGQLDLVRLSISQLGEDSETQRVRDIQAMVRSIVKKHEKLIQSARNLETAFNFALLLLTIGCVLTFCFQGYAVIRVTVNAVRQLNFFQVGFAVTITLSAVSHLFFCCWAADCLITKSSAVGDAIYHSGWYKLPHSKAHFFLLIGFKKFRPLEITSGKFAALSLDLFMKVIKMSMSYISMLLAVQSRRT